MSDRILFSGQTEPDAMVDTARTLARWLHRDQVDKQGEPYFLHLLRVAARVEEWGGTHEQVAAAWLHDAVEDTPISELAVCDIFGDGIGLTVAWLTRNKAGESYEAWIFNMTQAAYARPALLVKLADIEDHLSRLGGLTPEDQGRLGPRYSAAKARILEALGSDAPKEVS